MPEYDQQIEITNQPVTPTTIGGYLLVAALALLTGFLCINVFITRPYWEPDLGSLSSRLAALAEHGDEIDTIFIGSSHIGSAINPLIFDEANAAAGAPTRSFSLWMPNNTFGETAFLLEYIQGLQLPNLRHIIIEPRLERVPEMGMTKAYANAYSSRVRYIFDFERSLETLRFIGATDESARMKAAEATQLMMIFGIHLSNLGVLHDLAFIRGEPASSAEGWEYRGHELPKAEVPLPPDKLQPPDINRRYREISAAEKNALTTLVEQVRATGAEPVFLFPPTRRTVGPSRAIRDALAEQHPDVRRIEYLYEESYHPIYDQRYYWVDGGHLGLNGSRHFSELFSRDWLSQMQH